MEQASQPIRDIELGIMAELMKNSRRSDRELAKATGVSQPTVALARATMPNLPRSVHEQRWDEAAKPLPSNHKISKAKPLFKKIDNTAEELKKKLKTVAANIQNTTRTKLGS